MNAKMPKGPLSVQRPDQTMDQVKLELGEAGRAGRPPGVAAAA